MGCHVILNSSFVQNCNGWIEQIKLPKFGASEPTKREEFKGYKNSKGREEKRINREDQKRERKRKKDREILDRGMAF